MEIEATSIKLKSYTTEVILRASPTSKGLEIEIAGPGQRISIMKNGVEVAAVGSDGVYLNDRVVITGE